MHRTFTVDTQTVRDLILPLNNVWLLQCGRSSIALCAVALSHRLVRRQEIVFIGAGMDEAAITALLDEALLNEDEMVRAGQLSLGADHLCDNRRSGPSGLSHDNTIWHV